MRLPCKQKVVSSNLTGGFGCLLAPACRGFLITVTVWVDPEVYWFSLRALTP